MQNSFIFEGIELRRCLNAKPNHGTAQLYCSADGRFFSITRRSINEVKPSWTKNFKHKPNVHSYYPMMKNFTGVCLCHHLIYEAWIGQRTPGMEIDHINGDIFDWRACNLELVTPAENRRRAQYLRIMRQCEFDPRIFTRDDFHHFFSLDFDFFKTMLIHHKNDE